MDDHIMNTVEIAVLKEQINGLREQQKAHAYATSVQFEKLGGKVDDLIAIMNKGKGAYAASILMAGFISAGIVKAVGFVFSRL